MPFMVNPITGKSFLEDQNILQSQQTEIERLQAALRRYGLHEKGCQAFDWHGQCTCGFSAYEQHGREKE